MIEKGLGYVGNKIDSLSVKGYVCSIVKPTPAALLLHLDSEIDFMMC